MDFLLSIFRFQTQAATSYKEPFAMKLRQSHYFNISPNLISLVGAKLLLVAIFVGHDLTGCQSPLSVTNFKVY